MANANGFEAGLSPLYFNRTCHISRTTYVKCLRELKEKGYLIEVEFDDGVEGYIFLDSGFN